MVQGKGQDWLCLAWCGIKIELPTGRNILLLYARVKSTNYKERSSETFFVIDGSSIWCSVIFFGFPVNPIKKLFLDILVNFCANKFRSDAKRKANRRKCGYLKVLGDFSLILKLPSNSRNSSQNSPIILAPTNFVPKKLAEQYPPLNINQISQRSFPRSSLCWLCLASLVSKTFLPIDLPFMAGSFLRIIFIDAAAEIKINLIIHGGAKDDGISAAFFCV